jgi:hypothetical protein
LRALQAVIAPRELSFSPAVSTASWMSVLSASIVGLLVRKAYTESASLRPEGREREREGERERERERGRERARQVREGERAREEGKGGRQRKAYQKTSGDTNRCNFNSEYRMEVSI